MGKINKMKKIIYTLNIITYAYSVIQRIIDEKLVLTKIKYWKLMYEICMVFIILYKFYFGIHIVGLFLEGFMVSAIESSIFR